MDLGKLEIDKKAVGLIVLLELITVVTFGVLKTEFVKFKFRDMAPEYRLFSKADYTPLDNEYAPKSYQFVIVRYDREGNVLKESFYSWNGDKGFVGYKNGKWNMAGGGGGYKTIWLLFPIVGFIMLILSRIVLPITGAQVDDGAGPPSPLMQGADNFGKKLFFWGIHLFLSAFIFGPLSMIIFGF